LNLIPSEAVSQNLIHLIWISGGIDAQLSIPAVRVEPRNEHVRTGLADCLKGEKPQWGYEEMCYYHTMCEKSEVSIFNPKKKRD